MPPSPASSSAAPAATGATAGEMLARLDQRHDELLTRIDELNHEIESALESVTGSRPNE